MVEKFLSDRFSFNKSRKARKRKRRSGQSVIVDTVEGNCTVNIPFLYRKPEPLPEPERLYGPELSPYVLSKKFWAHNAMLHLILQLLMRRHWFLDILGRISLRFRRNWTTLTLASEIPWVQEVMPQEEGMNLKKWKIKWVWPEKLVQAEVRQLFTLTYTLWLKTAAMSWRNLEQNVAVPS